MYDIPDYGAMIADRPRMKAYEKALRRTIRPGACVLDVGTGTGIFALIACRLGARKVYALDPSDAIRVAREIASDNDLAGKIEFIQKTSLEADLPEKADVVVSDLRGLMPLAGDHINSIMDIRRRHLAPGGALIPRRDTLWAAGVEAPKIYGKFSAPWDDNPYGLDMEAARRLAVNNWRRGNVKPKHVMLEPRTWARLDYRTVESPSVSGSLSWKASRKGTLHGLSLWFDAELAKGVTFSNAPAGKDLVYGRGFFPLWRPVTLAAGDRVSVALRADHVDNDYLWQWKTTVTNKKGKGKADFSQSTFHGVPLVLEQLRKRAKTYVPTLTEEGHIALEALNMMARNTPLAEIAAHLAALYPKKFPTPQKALTRLGELSLKYT